ncbi:MAG TPA: DMT family transporter [Nocardioidaceae bacterium]|nr:DMT family transporter [Nocardioidaceae bacterium]
MTTSPVRSWLPLAAIAITLSFWASAFVAIRHLGEEVSPGALSLGRLLVGSLTLGVFLLARPRRWPGRRDWPGLVVCGVLWFGIYNLTLNEGERRVDAGTAAMLIQVAPILIAILATVFLRERPTWYLGAGLLLAFAGVCLIGLSTSGDGGRDLLGVALCLVAAAAYSVSMILQKPLLGRLSALEVTWFACTIGVLVCLPFAGDLLRTVGEVPLSSIGWIVYLGVFPTAIAFTTFAFALARMDASNLGVTTYLVPPITIALGWLFLREVPPIVAVVGGAVSLVGVAVARIRPHTRESALAQT